MNNPRSSSQPRNTQVKDEALFLANLPVIDAAVRQVCRRHNLAAVEAEDFASEVRLHFIERNYEPLRKFRGDCTLRTFLIVVVQHLFLDYRNRLWGKWRPSAEAKRQGKVAILVERLVTRDGWTFDQAIEIVRTNHGVEVSDELLARLGKLMQRAPARQPVAEVEAYGVESPAPAPDNNVLRAEQEFRIKRVQAALDRVLQTLSPDERLILKMRYDDGVSVADIARALRLNQKRLYRTIDDLRTRLRVGLEAEGIDRKEVAALLADAIDVEDSDTDQRAGEAGSPQPAERARKPWRKR